MVTRMLVPALSTRAAMLTSSPITSPNYDSHTESISLTNPNNIFELQNKVSDNLNRFQTTYARYLRCQEPDTAQNVNPSCDPNGKDSFTQVTISYNELLQTIDDLNNSYKKQQKTNKLVNEPTYNANAHNFDDEYNSMILLRNDLEQKLNKLKYELQNGPGSPKRLLDSAILANTLWIILASCLIYFIFIYT